MVKTLLLLGLILTALTLRAVEPIPESTATSGLAQPAPATQLHPATYSSPHYSYGEDNRIDPLI